MRTSALVLTFPLLIGACAVPPVRDSPRLTPIELAKETFSNQISLNRIVANLPVSESTYQVQYGMLCLPGVPRAFPTDRLPVAQNDMERAFRATLERFNYKFQVKSESVFEAPTAPDNSLLIGATIKKLEANFCFPFSGSPVLLTGATDLARGTAAIEIKWEVYSPLDRRVVMTHTATGTYTTPDSVSGGAATIVLRAFVESVRNLAASAEFAKTIRTRQPFDPEPKSDTGKT
jgi:serine protease Do